MIDLEVLTLIAEVKSQRQRHDKIVRISAPGWRRYDARTLADIAPTASAAWISVVLPVPASPDKQVTGLGREQPYCNVLSASRCLVVRNRYLGFGVSSNGSSVRPKNDSYIGDQGSGLTDVDQRSRRHTRTKAMAASTAAPPGQILDPCPAARGALLVVRRSSPGSARAREATARAGPHRRVGS